MRLCSKFFLLICLCITAGFLFFQSAFIKTFVFNTAKPVSMQKAGGYGPTFVETATVEKKDLMIIIEAVGTLLASESADIRAEIAGTVKAIHFSEGQPVKKGESLIQIDDALIQTELMKAEATYNVRKKTFVRSDKLKTSGYVSKQDWEETSGSLQEAKADIETARIRLEKAKVLNPFDGIAGLRNFSVGDYIQVGQVLTTLDALDPATVIFSVPERQYGDIKIGQNISFYVDAWPDRKFEGKIYAVSPRVNKNTRNIDIKARVSNLEGLLRPGMFASVQIVSSVHKDALLIPEESIIPKGNTSFVFVARDGKAAFQEVKLGKRQDGKVEVLEGVGLSEKVITAGMMKLQDKMPVKVVGP